MSLLALYRSQMFFLTSVGTEIGTMIIEYMTKFGTGIGAVLVLIGAYKTFEGFSQDNPSAQSSGFKLIIGGIGIIAVSVKITPMLASIMTF